MKKITMYELTYHEHNLLEIMNFEALPIALKLFRELDNFRYDESYDELSIGGTQVDFMRINDKDFHQIREFPKEFKELVGNEDLEYRVAKLLHYFFVRVA